MSVLTKKILIEGVEIPAEIFSAAQQKYNIKKLLNSDGIYGTAYLTSDKKILKYTEDKGEALFFNAVKGKEFKHIAKVFDVKRYSLKKSVVSTATYKKVKTFYFILREYIKPLNRKEKKHMDCAVNLYSLFRSKENKKKDAKQFLEYLNDKNKNDSENFLLKYDRQLLELFLNELRDLYKEIKYSYNVSDIHVDNLGWKNNRIAVFDLTSEIIDSKGISSF